MAFTACETISGNHAHAVAPACSLELIHTYSLIHDDLPCMDNDDYRRGRLTVHKKFNEGHAVLTGDYLCTYAYEILSTAPGLASDQKVKLIEILAKQSGGYGMVSGQVLDIEGEGRELSLQHLQEIHSKKTGALISASIEFGAVCAGASDFEMSCLQKFARELGIAFQITDDILDVTSGESKRGPQIPSDIKNGKATYVTLIGLEGSKKAAREHTDAALAALKQMSIPSNLLEEMALLIVQRTK